MRYVGKQGLARNLTFWFKCRNFKRLFVVRAGDRRIRAAMLNIYKSHVKEKAKKAVDLNARETEEIETRMESALGDLYDLFNVPQKKIYTIMFKDSYQPFLESGIFLEAVQREKSGKKFKPRKLKSHRVFLKKGE